MVLRSLIASDYSIGNDCVLQLFMNDANNNVPVCHMFQGRTGPRGPRGFPGPLGIGIKGDPGIPGLPGKPAFIRREDGGAVDPSLVSVSICYRSLRQRLYTRIRIEHSALLVMYC